MSDTTTLHDVEVLRVGLLYTRVCTSIQDDNEMLAAIEREVPCGTTGGWHFNPDEPLPSGDSASVPCADHGGRRHVVVLA